MSKSNRPKKKVAAQSQPQQQPAQKKEPENRCLVCHCPLTIDKKVCAAPNCNKTYEGAGVWAKGVVSRVFDHYPKGHFGGAR